MLLNGLNLSNKDLNQRYKGTYIKIRHTPDVEEQVVYVTEITGLAIMTNKEVLLLDEKFKIVQEFPQMGAVNFKGTVHHVLRKPLRQWSRGLSPEVINDFCRDDKAQTFNKNIQQDSAEALFNRTWESWETGCKKIKAGQINGFAITSVFWIKGTPKNMYLWQDRIPLGEVMGSKVMYFPECKLLKQEVDDFLRAANENSRNIRPETSTEKQ